MSQDEKCGCNAGNSSELKQGCGGATGNEHNNASKAFEKLPVNEFSSVNKVIAVMSGKGGVGKSLITSLLASGFRKRGYEVGVLDADITGPSLPKMFGVEGSVELVPFGLIPPESAYGVKVMSINLLIPGKDDPVIWRGPVLAGVVKQFWTDVVWTDLDYLFVDLPPGTGDVPLTVMQSIPLDGLIVVSSPQEIAVMIVNKAIKMAKLLGIPLLGLIENMSSIVCRHCGEQTELFGPGRGHAICEKFNIPFLGSLAIDPDIAQLCDQGKIEKYENDLFSNTLFQIIRNIGDS